MEKRFARDFSELDDIFRFVGEFAARENVPEAGAYAIKLAVEELFTNIVKYGSGSAEPILIRLAAADGNLVLEIVDFDAELFDPTAAARPPLDRPLEERKPGGLGLHLVRSVVDELTYDYKGRRLTVRAVKHLEK